MARLGSVPQYSKKSKVRPQSAFHGGSSIKPGNELNDDLPECSFKSILNHIINKKMFRDTEIKVLYVRLCHRYGEESIDPIWEYLMDELES